MSRAGAAVLAAVAIVLAVVVWMLATRPRDVAFPAPLADPVGVPSITPVTGEPSSVIATAPIRPRSLAEPDEAATRATTRSDALTVTVLDELGAPVQQAAVGLGLPSQSERHHLSPEQRTDSRGTTRFSLAKMPPGTEVFVIADGYAPVRERLAPDATEHVVRLGGAESLGGTVIQDGGPPAKRLTFMVRGFEDPTSEWPAPARDFLSTHEWGESRMKVTTRPGGSFSLRGLPPGQIVGIEIPAHLRLREPPDGGHANWVSVTTPRSGVVIDLVSLPVITGRPVLPPGSPLKLEGGLSIAYVIRRPAGTTERGSYGHIGHEFSISIEETDATGVTVNILNDYGVLATRTLDGPITRSVAFGDIPLEAGKQLNAVLTDAAGAPIAGGRVAAGGQFSGPTAVDGKATLPLTIGAKTLLAAAYGYRLRRIPLGETPPDPLVVVLEASNRLIVQVRMEDGSLPPSGVEVKLAFSRPMEIDAPERLGDFADIRGTRLGSMMTMAVSGGGGSYEVGYEVGAEGRIAVSDLSPGESIGIKVCDHYQHELARQNVELGPSETKTLEIALPGKPRTIAASVTDAAGAPIRNVEVEVGGGFFSSRERTDESGRFSFAGVLGEAPSLTLSAPGYVTLNVEGAEVFTRSRYVLEEGRSVWVQVVDSSGAPKDVIVTFLLADGTKLGATPRASGSYEVERAPKRPATVEARAGEEVASVAVGADQNQVRVVMGK